MESIMQTEKECFICHKNGATDPLEAHHIFNGANRKHSEKYGLKVWLCGNACHRNGPMAVHQNRLMANAIKAKGQTAFESHYGTREDFIQIFGRNYL